MFPSCPTRNTSDSWGEHVCLEAVDIREWAFAILILLAWIPIFRGFYVVVEVVTGPDRVVRIV